jgi:hypothetical protein
MKAAKPKAPKPIDNPNCSSCGLEHEPEKCPASGSSCSYCKSQITGRKCVVVLVKHVKVSSVQGDTESEGEKLLTISMDTSVKSTQEDNWDFHLGIKDQ